MHQKLVLLPFLILVNNPNQPLHTRNSFKNCKKLDILKEDYQKALKINFSFSFKSSYF